MAQPQGRKSVGIVKRDKKTGLVEIAKPIGVVGAILPVTIPVTNFMSNTMFSLKSRNAVIAAPHPKSVRTVATTVSLVLAALARFDVPENLIQALKEPSIDLTRELCQRSMLWWRPGACRWSGPPYSSGKPAYGVGPGNVQCIVDRNMDIEDVVPKIVDGRAFNNGLPCACEQAVMIHRDEVVAALKSFATNKAFFVDDPGTIKKLAESLYVDGVLSRESMGITAVELAKKVGLSVPSDTRILLVKADSGTAETLRKEKLSPVTLLYAYSTFEEALEIARSKSARERPFGCHSFE